jgi:hypothetical protein
VVNRPTNLKSNLTLLKLIDGNDLCIFFIEREYMELFSIRVFRLKILFVS